MRYLVVFSPDEGGKWHASIPAVPGCHTWGSSLEEARGRIREALEVSLDVTPENAERIAREAELVERIDP